MTKLTAHLQGLNQTAKITIVAAADLVVLTLAVLAAYALRLSDFRLPPADRLGLYLVAPLLSVASAFLFHVYRSAARSYSSSIERRVALSQLLVPLVWSLILLFVGVAGFARSVVLIYTVLAIVAMVVLRRVAAHLFAVSGVRNLPAREQVPVLIYGAGREGLLVAEALRRQGRHRPVAFLDTDYTLIDRTVADLRVYSVESIASVVKKLQPREVVVAKPQSSRASRRVLVDMLIEQGLAVKIVPAVADVVDGKINVTDLRPVNVEDLLGRDPVPPEQALMDKAIKAQVVMITGAGGSIGSELARQAAAFFPRKLVLVDSNEFALFEVHRQLEARAAGCTLVPLLADVKDGAHMASIMREHAVDVVFHAAAYKHVRMVQENAAAGIANNVFGTRATAEAAIATGVKRFILISTDKAVRPTSIMGASKRVSEMVVQALASEKGHSTIFSMVRFGNVLGSTGSVVPLFREQIAAGGPVLVTHPEVTRYFMLIPEAAQLVIQAGAMAEGGEVFVLDMGESVKITQLAETMIELAGLTRRDAEHPDGDIEIRFIGLRDGEKLYEELHIGNNAVSTQHARIMKCHEFHLGKAALAKRLQALNGDVQAGAGGAAAAALHALAGME